MSELQRGVNSARQHFLDSSQRHRLLARLQHVNRVDFSRYRLETIEQSVVRRVSQRSLDSLECYLALLEVDEGELHELCAGLRVGVTGFFRDDYPFQVLQNRLFAHLQLQDGSPAPVRIWVAGCATGEEAYSVAMSWLEAAPAGGRSRKVEIFATDIDEGALAAARKGVYAASALENVSKARLEGFFVRVEHGYQVRREVRSLIVFARHDLVRDPPFARIDLVSCRNVLVYLEPQTQSQVRQSLYSSLVSGGHLLVGTSESLGDAADLFSVSDIRARLYSKRGARLSTQRWISGPAPTPTKLCSKPSAPALAHAMQPRHVDGPNASIARSEELEKALQELVLVRRELQQMHEDLSHSRIELAVLQMENRALTDELLGRSIGDAESIRKPNTSLQK